MLYQTNVLHEDYNPKYAYPRSNKSWKWKHILGSIWNQLKTEYEGSGISLLPRHPVRRCCVYLHKNGHCCMVQTTRCGKGLYLSPRPSLGVRGNGLYLKAGSTLYDGHGLLLEKKTVHSRTYQFWGSCYREERQTFIIVIMYLKEKRIHLILFLNHLGTL